MPGAGELDQRITIERQPTGTDDVGGETNDWSVLTTVWAKRTDVSDTEKVSANQVNAALMSRFVIRSSSTTRTVTAKDRLSHDGANWGITGVKETADGRRRFIEITAVRQSD